MDLDIEMGESAEAVHDIPVDQLPEADDILQPDEPDEPGEIADDAPAAQSDDANTVVPNKLNVRGVDTLHTDDIKAYAKAHFGPVDKVEWVDDTSVNLVFSSDSVARDAIVALSSIEIADATALPAGESLPAKPVEGRPETTLHVRFALSGDKKQPGAALRSRYYLLHPEHDPEERRRKHQESRSRYRDRDGGYRRNGGRRRRDSDDEIETFEASMYDDAPQPARANSSDPDDRRRSFTRENRGKELFAGRVQRRDRSASPLRDGDGDAAMDSFGSSSRNRTSARSIRNRISEDNRSKELFPSKASGRGGQLDRLEDTIGSAHLRDEDRPKVVSVPGDASKDGSLSIKGMANQSGESSGGFNIRGAANARELFPGKLGSNNYGKELFDSNRSKQRQKAQDLFG